LARFIWPIHEDPGCAGGQGRAANRAGGVVLRYALEL
jgi:hypothetical protein